MTETTPAPTDIVGDYVIDPAHSRVGFSAKHAMVTTVRGAFTGYSGTVHLDETNPAASSVTLDIEAASVSTGNDDRDKHLHAPDFFDTENHPHIRFVSTSVTKTGDNTYDLAGDLTIRDTTNPVTVSWESAGTAVDPYGNHRAGFEGTAEINRKDWGLTFNAPLAGGGVLVSDKIKLEFDISAIRQG